MQGLSLPWQALVVALGGVLYFATIYVVAGLLGTWIRAALIKRAVGKVLDPRALPPGQIRRELQQSAVSILIFGVGILVPWGMVKLGWSQVHDGQSPLRVGIELLVLLVWNDVHFYAMHRSLHHPKLVRAVHAAHHQSVVTTPWSTYAFHPVEALMLGSVLLLPMLIWPFTLASMMLLPILSLTYNTVGHCNYRALPRRWQWLSNAQDHHLHHACHRGNFGFLFTFMDQIFGTRLPHDAAKAVIAAGLAREARQP